jgi:hypothetical protein
MYDSMPRRLHAEFILQIHTVIGELDADGASVGGYEEQRVSPQRADCGTLDLGFW